MARILQRGCADPARWRQRVTCGDCGTVAELDARDLRTANGHVWWAGCPQCLGPVHCPVPAYVTRALGEAFHEARA